MYKHSVTCRLLVLVLLSASCASKHENASEEAPLKIADSLATTAKEEPLPVITTSTFYKYEETKNGFELKDEGGPGPYEFTCTGLTAVNASSTLTSRGTLSYSIDMLKDQKESTAWVEGKDGLGIGEWVEFKITDEYKKWYPSEQIRHLFTGTFVIQTGYAKSPLLWKQNSRPVKFKCFLNSKAVAIVEILDTPNFQTFSPFKEPVQLKVGDAIRFEILDISPGTKFEDTCISEFHMEGSCN